MVLCRHPVLDDCQNAMLLSSRKVPDPREGNRLLELLESSWGVGGNKVGTRRSPWATNKPSSIFCFCSRPKHHQGPVRTWRLSPEGFPVEPLEIEPRPVLCSPMLHSVLHQMAGMRMSLVISRLPKRQSILCSCHCPLGLDWLWAGLVLA